MKKDIEKAWQHYYKDCKKILDIGCGDGKFIEFVKSMNQQDLNVDVLGVDIDEKNIKLCKQKGLNTVCEDIFDFFEKEITIYDGIYLGHVIEHLSPKDAGLLIDKINHVLETNGIFMIATPDVKDIKNMLHGFWTDPTHV